MTRWPDFFIVGAPRCGTTSLYFYLKGHPDIFLPSVKEPHYFADVEMINAIAAARGFAPPTGMVQREDAYLRMFKNARPNQVTGEASVNYLSHHLAADRIKEKNSAAKIIAILRQPVDRAYSHFLLGLGQKTGREALFYEALRAEIGYMSKYSDEWGMYISGGLYYKQVRRYIDTFGTDQVRVYLHDDLASDTTAFVRDVCSFLEVPFDDGRFFDADRNYNTYGTLRSSLSKSIGRSRAVRSLIWAALPSRLRMPLRDRLISRGQPKPTMDPRALEFLRPIYQGDIVKLQDLIGRDLRSWLAEDEEGNGNIIGTIDPLND